MTNQKLCPTCKQPLPDPHRLKRICWKCGKPIGAHHKWIFGADSRPEHRNCEQPFDYVTQDAVDLQKKLVLEN
jgi:hypothetical protein